MGLLEGSFHITPEAVPAPPLIREILS
jgi:hypothetical protein